MSETNTIVCTNLHKTYSEGELQVKVLDGINLTVEKGSRIAIVGSSGSGKSTLLHLLGGLDSPSEGRVLVAGQVIHTLGEKEKSDLRNRELGFIYQFHHLLPEFSALENVAIPLLISGVDAAEAENEASEILTKVGLVNRLQHKPGELSGGERQRAAIARALVTKPACILADEPTGNLDEKTADKVFDVMLELNQEYGLSLLMVTHNLTLASRLDNIYELRDGALQVNS
ncbi:MAG: lipoprotein-releasing ABC transporter ATP-binding protein LolD [Gammaproteobacteria bacterium]|nr:lipoprotein-releasing ABC transporter ATP-binding protein LolD [Gammaproteobacteria bacterium]